MAKTFSKIKFQTKITADSASINTTRNVLTMSISQPLNFIRMLLDEQITIKLRGAREITGKLQAFDEHCNLMLSDAVETIFEINEQGQPETNNELKSTTKTHDELLMIRGDSVILLTPTKEE